MAIFQGEELVDVPTPDGRVLKLPRSVVPASVLQQIGQTTSPVGPVGPTAYTPETPGPGPEVPSVTGGQLPTEQSQVVETAPAPPPDQVVATVDNTPEAVAKSNKAFEKQQKAQAVQAASAAGQVTAAANKQDAATANQANAIDQQALVEGAAQDMMGRSVAARNAAIDDIMKKRAEDAQKNLDAEDAKAAEIDALRKKIAGTKIDRSADHPLLGLLFVALAGAGQAIDKKTGPNPALEAYYQAVDRKVAAQTADLDQMARVYGMTRDELTDMKDKSKRRLEFFNTMIAGEIDKGARALEEMAAKSASEKTKANAKVMIADLQARAQEKATDALHWGLDYEQKDRHQQQQIGLGYANLKESKRHNMQEEQLKREDMYLDQQKYLAGLKAKGDEEAYKAQLKQTEEVGKRGVRDLNGDVVLTPEGKAKMDQAKQLEDQANQLEESGKVDPLTFSVKGGKGSVDMMRQRASQLRGEASLSNVVLAHSDTEAVTVSNMLSSGQSTVQLIDGIKQLADQAGRGLIKRDQMQAKVQAMFSELAPNLKEAWQLGAWDKGSANLVKEIIGADPSSEWSAGTLGAFISRKMYEDPQNFKGRLDTVADGLERAAKNKMVNLGAKYGKDDRVFSRSAAADISPEAAKISQARSGTELLQNADEVNPAIGAARKIAYPFSPGFKAEAEQLQSTKYVGLSKDQEAPFESRLQAYKKGDKRAGEELVALAVEASQSRPDLALPMLKNMQTFAPKLYEQARTAMPADSTTAKQFDAEEKQRIGTAAFPTDKLRQDVMMSIDSDGKITDQDGFRELVQRGRAGDKAASKAVLDAINTSGANRTLPKGSTFREGR